MNIIISGFGNTGKSVVKYIESENEVNIHTIVTSYSHNSLKYKISKNFYEIDNDADVIIDFSNPDRIYEILEYGLKTKTPIIIGTTGYNEEQLEKIEEASKVIPIFKSYNTSIGVTVMLKLIKIATRLLAEYDIEIIEKHHNRKVDAPCGTAYMTADIIKEVRCELENIYGRKGLEEKRNINELGIHTIRGGTMIGSNDVILAGNDEILEIKHHAQSNTIFAVGAIKACKFIINKEPGLYDMNDII